MKVIVAGAGIGGLGAALALARLGHEVQVIERVAVRSDAGAGIQLSPNAMKALAALGVADRIEALASEPQALELRIGKTGQRVFSIPVGAAARERYGAPYLHIHRADLVDVLLSAAESAGVKVRMGARVAGHVQEALSAGVGDGVSAGVSGSARGVVRVGLDTGDVIAADVLVGADGVRSAVRAQLFGADEARFTGAVAWRALAPVEAYPDLPVAAVVWVGAGRHAVTYRVRGGALINFVGVVEERGWTKEGWDEVGAKADLAAAFEGWAPDVTAVIGAARSVHRWALYDRDAMAAWSVGQVTLLGDAAHAMPPFQAQGAAMALEDAVVLARVLTDGGEDVAAALQHYEALRMARTAKVLASARGNMGMFHRSNAVTQAVTYAPMMLADKVVPGFVRSRQDWIYAYDAAAAAKG